MDLDASLQQWESDGGSSGVEGAPAISEPSPAPEPSTNGQPKRKGHGKGYGQPGRSGPPGNRHGLQPGHKLAGRGGPLGHEKTLSHGLTKLKRTGRLPGRFRAEQREVNAMRAEWEAELTADGRRLTLMDSAYLDAACFHLGRRLLAMRWLAENPTLPVGERLKFTREAGIAEDARIKALAALDLTVKERGKIDWGNVFDAPAALATEPNILAADGGASPAPTVPELSTVENVMGSTDRC